MSITNINPNFPILSAGNIIDIDDPVLGKFKGCAVMAVWYPKCGDTWSETAEIQHLGLYNSKPKQQFPQILISVKGRSAVMYGTDAEYIKKIHPKPPL